MRGDCLKALLDLLPVRDKSIQEAEKHSDFIEFDVFIFEKHK